MGVTNLFSGYVTSTISAKLKHVAIATAVISIAVT